MEAEKLMKEPHDGDASGSELLSLTEQLHLSLQKKPQCWLSHFVPFAETDSASLCSH